MAPSIISHCTTWKLMTNFPVGAALRASKELLVVLIAEEDAWRAPEFLWVG